MLTTPTGIRILLSTALLPLGADLISEDNLRMTNATIVILLDIPKVPLPRELAPTDGITGVAATPAAPPEAGLEQVTADPPVGPQLPAGLVAVPDLSLIHI